MWEWTKQVADEREINIGRSSLLDSDAHFGGGGNLSRLGLHFGGFDVSGMERERGSDVSPSPHCTSHMLLRSVDRQANRSPETRSGKQEVGEEISLSLHYHVFAGLGSQFRLQ